MLLINVDGRGRGRATTDNQHIYPPTGYKEKVAAGFGLSAKGLINDSSVAWR